MDYPDSSLSSNDCRKISHEDIELVQNLIERCLQRYMTRDEVVDMLVNGVQNLKIEPHFTKLVWQRLEEENPEFFSAYNVKLKLKKQIDLFNQLLEKQHHMMVKGGYFKVTQPSFHNGINRMSVNLFAGNPSQQSYFPSLDATDVEPLCFGSSYNALDGVPTAASSYPIQQNGYAANDYQEMATLSYGQFSSVPDEFRSFNVQPTTLDATLPSTTCSPELFQLSLDDKNGNSSDNLSSYYNTTIDMTNIEDPSALQIYQSTPVPLPDGNDVLDIDKYLIADPPCLEPEIAIDKEIS